MSGAHWLRDSWHMDGAGLQTVVHHQISAPGIDRAQLPLSVHAHSISHTATSPQTLSVVSERNSSDMQ